MNVSSDRLHLLLDAAERATVADQRLAQLAAHVTPATETELDQVIALRAALHASPLDRDVLREALQPTAVIPAPMAAPPASPASATPTCRTRWHAWKGQVTRWTTRLPTDLPALASRTAWLTRYQRAQRWEKTLLGVGGSLVVISIGLILFWLGPQVDANLKVAQAAIHQAGSFQAWQGNPAHPSVSYQAWKAIDAAQEAWAVRVMGLAGVGLGLSVLGLPWSVRARQLRPVKASPQDRMLWAQLPETRAYLAQRPADVPLLQIERDCLRLAVNRSALGQATEQIGAAPDV